MEPQISIIILNWNGYGMTLDCLISLFEISYENYNVILVDNGSTDDSVEKLRNRFDNSCLDIISLNSNYGFTGGNNIAMEYAQEKYDPDFYLLLNNDTIVDKFFLDEMVEVFYNASNCFAVVPKIYYYGNKNVLWFAGGSINKLTGLIKHYGRNRMDSDKYNYQKKTTFMTGCAALISKEAIKEVGMLDNRFFAYSEDTDYSLRILNSNHVTLYAPKAIIYHKVGHSSETNKGKWFAFYLATRNVIFLQKKHLSNLLFPLFIVSFGIRWVLYMSIKLTLLGDFKSIKGIYWGIIDGVFNRSRFYINNPFPNQKTFLRKEGRKQS